MNIWKRRIVAFASVAALASGVVYGGDSAEVRADDFDEGVNCLILNGVSCVHVEDARQWAFDVTSWKFGSQDHHNDMGDAFRHCSWMGALATRIGFADAYRVGFVHEDYDTVQPSSERLMDDWNNYIGAGIGNDAVQSGSSDQWGYVLSQCESLARGYQLYGLDGRLGGYVQ